MTFMTFREWACIPPYRALNLNGGGVGGGNPPSIIAVRQISDGRTDVPSGQLDACRVPCQVAGAGAMPVHAASLAKWREQAQCQSMSRPLPSGGSRRNASPCRAPCQAAGTGAMPVHAIPPAKWREQAQCKSLLFCVLWKLDFYRATVVFEHACAKIQA